MELFTPEDKKTLRLASRYLQSLGISSGNIDFSFYDGDTDVDLSNEVPFGSGDNTTFSNHYNVTIPEQLYPIIDKILLYCNGKLDFDVDVEFLNYLRFEIEIDAERKEVNAVAYCGYYDAGDEDGTSWDTEDPDEGSDVKNVMKTLREQFNNSFLVLRYNGGGDSGYIESAFENNEPVPQNVEQWCYEQLENLHGGWEINEGSQGYFEFDLEKGVIYLSHTFNQEVDKQNTIFEESFGK